MSNSLRANIADQRLSYHGKQKELTFDRDRILEYNHRHHAVLGNYDLQLEFCQIQTFVRSH